MNADALGTLVLLLQLASTFTMVGLIWFVQCVHYPLFAGVGREAFAAYENEHVARTNLVVGPPMLIEAATALALVVRPHPAVPEPAAWLGLVLLVVVWLSTGLLQVPRHRELAKGYDAAAHRRLVATNWIRTAAWTLRGALLIGVLALAH